MENISIIREPKDSSISSDSDLGIDSVVTEVIIPLCEENKPLTANAVPAAAATNSQSACEKRKPSMADTTATSLEAESTLITCEASYD